MAMKLVREGKKTEYKQENGQIITVVQPEVYQRIYCKNCDNEVDSEEQATGTCNDCGKPTMGRTNGKRHNCKSY